MAVSRAASSSASSSHHSSDELSDHDDTDIDSDDDILDLNTSNLQHGASYHPQPHHQSHQVPIRQSSSRLQELRTFEEKRSNFDSDTPVGPDSPIQFDEYWKEFGRRRQQKQRFPAKPRYYPPHQPHFSHGTMSVRPNGGPPGQDAFAYADSRQRRPLINYVNNNWRSSSTMSDSSHNEYGAPSAGQILAAPRIRRILYIVLTFLLVIWYWGSWSKPSWDENRAIEKALAGRKSANGQFFGTNLRPDFVGMKHTDYLDKDLIPGTGRKERLIIVGDVHGCYDELTALLTEISFVPSTDHLVFTGDMISKGPSSPGVIDLAIQHNASCVRGNHEDRILLTHRDVETHTLSSSSQRASGRKGGHDDGNPAIELTGPSETDDYIDEPIASTLPMHGNPAEVPHELDAEHFPVGPASDHDLATTFTDLQLRYLKSCPVLLHLGTLPSLGPTTVVHAGLVPGVSLAQQDPVGAMNMRTLDLETYVPSPDSNGGATWSRVWEKFQKSLPANERSTVVYGHDSKKGLQIRKWTKGLDSGCVMGGKLTALVYDRKTLAHPGEVQVVSVPCTDHRPKRGGLSIELGQS